MTPTSILDEGNTVNKSTARVRLGMELVAAPVRMVPRTRQQAHRVPLPLNHSNPSLNPKPLPLTLSTFSTLSRTRNLWRNSLRTRSSNPISKIRNSSSSSKPDFSNSHSSSNSSFSSKHRISSNNNLHSSSPWLLVLHRNRLGWVLRGAIRSRSHRLCSRTILEQDSEVTLHSPRIAHTASSHHFRQFLKTASRRFSDQCRRDQRARTTHSGSRCCHPRIMYPPLHRTSLPLQQLRFNVKTPIPLRSIITHNLRPSMAHRVHSMFRDPSLRAICSPSNLNAQEPIRFQEIPSLLASFNPQQQHPSARTSREARTRSGRAHLSANRPAKIGRMECNRGQLEALII